MRNAPKPFRLRLAVVLLGLVASVLVPALMLGAMSMRHAASGQRAAAEGLLDETALALSLAVNADISGLIQGLSALSSGVAFDAGPNADPVAAGVTLRRASAALGTTLAFILPDGRRLLRTDMPANEPIGSTLRTAELREVLETAQPVVGNFRTHGGLRASDAVAMVPVLRDGKAVAVLAARIDAARLGRLLAESHLQPGTLAALVDRQGSVLPVPGPGGMWNDDRMVPASVVRIAAANAGPYRATTPDGVERVFAAHTIPFAPGWLAVVGVPARQIDAIWQRQLYAYLAGGALALLAGGLTALLAARQILTPLFRLGEHARAIAATKGSAAKETAAALPKSRITELEALRLGFAAAEQALQNNQAELRQLMMTVDLGAFMTRDMDGTIRHWSQGCERLYGWSASEAIGRSVHALLRTVFPIPLADIEAALRHDGFWEGDLRHRARDGRELVVTARKILRRDGPHTVLEVLTDVTAQRRAESALAESEQTWRTLAESHPGMVFETNPDGWNTYTNTFFQEFVGLPPEGLLGDGWVEVLHPDDRQRSIRVWSEAVVNGSSYEAEYRFRAADGTYRWFLCRGVPQRGAGNAIVRWFGAGMDITEIVEAREAAARNADLLERQVAERTQALRESEARLAQAAKMEALGRLAGGVAHDFNNVLQAVHGGAALAMLRLRKNADQAEARLQLVIDAAERGVGVTQRLLAFARRGDLSGARVEPAPLLEGIAHMLRHTLGPSIVLRVEVAAGTPALFADANQLETVLVNLANNARDAMADRGGMIRLIAAAADAGDARPAQLAAGDYVRVLVADDGIGMPSEVLSRVTEPFFTTKPKGKGTGLGLAMASGFAEQSGGTLTIDSARDRGTTVTLWLPVADQAADGTIPALPAPEHDPQHEAARKSLSLLLTEDEPDVRSVLAGMLTEQGHRVIEAEDGAAALALLESGTAPDLLLTDLSMPGGVDGVTLIERARERHPGLPAILITGHADEARPEGLELAGRTGRFAVLRKPVPAGALAAAVAEVAAAEVAVAEVAMAEVAMPEVAGAIAG